MSKSSNIADLLQHYKQSKERGKKHDDNSWWKEQIGGGDEIGLSIGGSVAKLSTTTNGESSTLLLHKDAGRKRKHDLAHKGFSRIDESIAEWGMPVGDDDFAKQGYLILDKLQRGIIHLHRKQNLPATFIFLFDEAWTLAQRSRIILQNSCHSKNKFNFDVLAWYIPPGQSGFSPHRDRQPEQTIDSFHYDKINDDEKDDDDSYDDNGNNSKNVHPDPKFVTHWIALSDATPVNSCLYVIPKNCDPGYLEGDNDDRRDPLQACLSNKESYQHIQAVPRTSGQSILFSHRLIHWGSRSEPDQDNPRIAISFVCSDPDYEPPLLEYDFSSPNTMVPPPVPIRLLLICAQLIIYYQRFELSRASLRACYDYCKEMETHLGTQYRQKVSQEFVKAMNEFLSLSTSATSSSTTKAKMDDDHNDNSGDHHDDDDDNNGFGGDGDSDDEEAMMEEILAAEQSGYGEFDDDYDEVDEAHDNEGKNNVDDEDHEDEGGSIADDDDDDDKDVVIFGKRALESSTSELSKRVKKALGS